MTGKRFLKYKNPEIPEGINTTDAHPLREFAFLSAAAITLIIIVTAALALLTDQLAGYIPFELEVSASRSIAEKLNDESNEVDDYLQALTDKIVINMNMPDNIKITAHYVNDDVVNAMATLGGHVMVYRGLLEQLPSENALVMLLGHEIGHVKLRHPVKALSKGIVVSLFMQAILGGASDSAADVLVDTSMLTMLSFSREQEQDSDDEGIHALHAYYGHVQDATRLFEILKQNEYDEVKNVPQFLSSHPDTGGRIKHLNQLAQMQSFQAQGEIHAIPDNIIIKLANDKQDAREEHDKT